MTVAVYCPDCGHRHDLKDHTYNNLLWQNEEVLCRVCGTELQSNVQSPVVAKPKTEDDHRPSSNEETQLSVEADKPRGGGSSGPLTFGIWYLSLWAFVTYSYGVEGFSFMATPFAILGVMWLLSKWAGED